MYAGIVVRQDENFYETLNDGISKKRLAQLGTVGGKTILLKDYLQKISKVLFSVIWEI